MAFSLWQLPYAVWRNDGNDIYAAYTDAAAAAIRAHAAHAANAWLLYSRGSNL